MDKEDNGMNGEGKSMSIPLERASKKPSFSDFVKEHKEQIQKLADFNWEKNSDGQYIIPKDDPWRQEHHWDELHKELKDKK